MKFDIPYPPTKKGKAAWNKRFGLNAYYAGKHWSARKRDAEELHTLAILCMKKAGIENEIFEKPVCITFLFNDGLDCSNHAAIVKMIEDAMKTRVIKDDGPKYVRSITVGFHEKDCITVIVREAQNEGY